LVGDKYEQALKRRGQHLTKYISKKLNVPIKLVYAKPNSDADGQCVCKRELIIVYWNKTDWNWLKEVIVHECAHRLDCSIRGFMHHNVRYEHDEKYWICYDKMIKY